MSVYQSYHCQFIFGPWGGLILWARDISCAEQTDPDNTVLFICKGSTKFHANEPHNPQRNSSRDGHHPPLGPHHWGSCEQSLEANTLLLLTAQVTFSTLVQVLQIMFNTHISQALPLLKNKDSDLIVLFRIKNLLQYILVSSYAIQK